MSVAPQTVSLPHQHRRPKRKDFEGKTVAKFRRDADNIWRIWFTDGSAFAIQAETTQGIGYMELCDVCVRPIRTRATGGGG